MDAAAVFFEAKPKSANGLKGAKTVPQRSTGSKENTVSVSITIACDKTNLPLCFTFNSEAKGKIEKMVTRYFTGQHIGTLSVKKREEIIPELWAQFVWAPRGAQYDHSGLLLTDFSCHERPFFPEVMKLFQLKIELILGGYTSILQMCHLDVVQLLKTGTKKQFIHWSRVYAELGYDCCLPASDR